MQTSTSAARLRRAAVPIARTTGPWRSCRRGRAISKPRRSSRPGAQPDAASAAPARWITRPPSGPLAGSRTSICGRASSGCWRGVKRRLHHLLGSSVDAPAIGRIQSLGVDADQGTRRPDRRGRSVGVTATLLGVEFLIGWADQAAHKRPAKTGCSVSNVAFGALYVGANLRVGRQRH